MEALNGIWDKIAPIVAFLLSSGVLTAIMCGIIKGSISKKINEVNIGKIEEKAVNSGVDKIKEISFKQSIQPLVNSELEKFYEEAIKYTKDSIGETNNNLLLIVNMFEALASYFDNSIGVSDGAKENLKNAIAIAKSSIIKQEIEKTEEIVEPIIKEEIKEVVKTKENNIER